MTLEDFLNPFLSGASLQVPTLGACSFLTGHQSVSSDSHWWVEPRMSDFPPDNVCLLLLGTWEDCKSRNPPGLRSRQAVSWGNQCSQPGVRTCPRPSLLRNQTSLWLFPGSTQHQGNLPFHLLLFLKVYPGGSSKMESGSPSRSHLEPFLLEAPRGTSASVQLTCFHLPCDLDLVFGCAESLLLHVDFH